ncbi:c-type cytochrome [Methylohalobius crimeensis]|uniref:c-type cytochrome n=1 Tax=Methylohalobius crimeensis TaxID=244365 RepID=UPI0003B55584|nr:hypothetical protein [Methylohalobius crimeensis]
MTTRGKKLTWLAVLLFLAVSVGITVWVQLFREGSQEHLADATAEEWFKYGSIGSESSQGVPYWIWLVLPKVFPDYIPGPGGYTSFGFVWEQGRELPVGFSKKTIGFERVAFNCAFCHITRYRLQPDQLPHHVAAGPGHTIRAQDYARFLARAGNDDRFNPDTLMPEIDRIYDMSWIQTLFYRYFIIPATKKALVKNGWQLAWTITKPEWGPGRIDPFNPIKFGILQMGIDNTIGSADMVPIWDMAARSGFDLHWDGLNTDYHEVVVSSAIGDGMTYQSIPEENLARIEQWLQEFPAPKSPFNTEQPQGSPYRLDPDKLAAGESLFIAHCGECHSRQGKHTGKVIPVKELGTDRHRVDMWTQEAANRYNAYQKEYDWGMEHFRNVDGYVAVLLDGLWLRGPYLHNGSVPTVRDLLNGPDQRPQVFYRGHDLIDPVNLGFISHGREARQAGFRFDTRIPGNGNQGHTYGINLSAMEKDALLEFLKTL